MKWKYLQKDTGEKISEEVPLTCTFQSHSETFLLIEDWRILFGETLPGDIWEYTEAYGENGIILRQKLERSVLSHCFVIDMSIHLT